MNIVLKEINSFTREITVEVPWEELETIFAQTVTRFSRNLSIPGFRKGKVPKRMILQNFRADVETKCAETALEEYYQKALREEGITPINRAEIDNMEFQEGNPLKFKATFEVVPYFKLPNYRRKLKVKKNSYIPDEEDVDNYIDDIRQQLAELRTVESGSKEGHLLLVDMQEMDNSGVPIIGRKVEDRYIKVGDGIFGGENLNRLTGLKSGDRTFIYIQRQNEQNKVGFELTIKNVHEEVLPEIDEKFIKKLDKNASNVEEFRQNILSVIQSRLDRDANVLLHEAIIDYFLQNTSIEVPPSMIDTYIDGIIEDKKNQNGEKLDEEKLREELKSSTIRSIKWYLIRRVIIKEENLSVSDEEVSEKVEGILKKAGKEVKEARRYYKKPSNRERLGDNILDEKLFNLLESVAKVNEVKVYTRDLRKQRNMSLNL
ncbi:MAG: trigger factor [Candidatus Marinimicrobia bacterium]|nr:trigger factor [Candidatus Neomarinimicrobiota bacterium]